MKIYPAIDITGGRCKRLKQGDMSLAKEYGDPVEMAKQWAEMGASYLHVVDLDAAFEGKFVNRNIIKEIVHSVKIPVQVGGGIRCAEDITDRIEGVGISRVIIGTMACEDEDLVKWAVSRYGTSRIAIGIDAKNGKVATKGWASQTDIDPVELAERMKALGVSNIIYTDIGRDGMLCGPEIEKTTEIVKKTWINVIASGGMRSIDDISKVKGTGASGVIIGTALYEGTIDLKEALKAAK